jgi:hypothetical protein
MRQHLLAWLAMLGLAGGLDAADLKTLAGKTITGDLASADASGVVFTTSTGPVKVPLADVVAITTSATPVALPAETYTDIELLDGSLFHAKSYRIVGKTLSAELLSGQKIDVPLSALFTILTGAQDARIRADWNLILSKRGKRDMLVIAKGDRLEPLEGTIGEGTDDGERINFTLASGGKLPRPPLLDRLQGMIFVRRLEGAIPPTVCKATDVHRNYLVAASLSVRDQVTITTVSGVKVSYPGPQSLLKLDFSQGKLLYLSELEPIAVDSEWTDETGLPSYARDRNLVDDDGSIRLNGAMVPRGLAVHAGANLTYVIGGDYTEFRAMVGIDDAVTANIAVQLVIEGDNRELFSGEIRRSEPPKTVVFDVKGVQQLRVSVSATEGLNLGKHVTLGDAKVSK